MPSPKVKSILLNHDSQVIQYNTHDPPHLTEEDEEDDKDQSAREHDDDDSNYEDPEDTSQDQDQETPPIQPSGMDINLPLPVINTMKKFDIFQV
eukprot:14475355-Ditylum_brightwellii.AAC.1